MRRILQFFVVLTLSLTAGEIAAAQTDPSVGPPATSPTSAPLSPASSTTTTTEPTSAPATAPTSAPSTQPAPVRGIALADLATHSESASKLLRQADADLNAQDATFQIENELPSLTREIDGRLDESGKLLAGTPSLDTIRTLDANWKQTRDTLSDWNHEISRRSGALGRDRQNLAPEAALWQETLAGQKETAVDADVQSRTQATATSLRQMLARLDREQAQLAELQSRVAAQDVRVRDAIDVIDREQERALSRLFSQDSAPLWEAAANPSAGADNVEGRRAGSGLASQSRDTIRSQLGSLIAYVQRHWKNLIVHLFAIVAVTYGINWMHRQLGAGMKQDPELAAGMTVVFDKPIATAVVVTMLLGQMFYPQAPRLFWLVLGSATLIPTVIVLRRVIARPIVPLLYMLMVATLVRLVLATVAALPLVSRLLFLLLMLGVAIFLIFYLRAARDAERSRPDEAKLWRRGKFLARIGLVISIVSVISNSMGYVALSQLVGVTMLVSAYIGVVLDAAVRVLDGLFVGVTHLPFAHRFGAIYHHRALVRNRVRLILAFFAFFWWLIITLDVLSIRPAVFSKTREILEAKWGVGALNLSLGGVLAFALTVTAAFMLSRFVRFLLQEDVYPRLHLARGVPYAVSTLLHYTVLFLGFLAGIAALDTDMTKFTILASAFGVGLGFGMQNIVNNFVSGLILLFERPIQIGDVVELDAATVGVITRIGIRSSILRTPNSAEIIVPNGILISGRVTNWTLSDRKRGIEIIVPVARTPTIDPQKVITLLTDVAKSHKYVAQTPAPSAFIVEFVAAGIKFELQAWTNRVEEWMLVRSDLTSAINAALSKEGIAIQ